MRIEAANGEISLTANQVTAGIEAEVQEEGVCYLRYNKLLPIICTYKDESHLVISVSEDGIHIGKTLISAGKWQITPLKSGEQAEEKWLNKRYSNPPRGDDGDSNRQLELFSSQDTGK